jgi:hypothetical protein
VLALSDDAAAAPGVTALFFDGRAELHGHRGVFHLRHGGDQIVDAALRRIVFNARLVSFELDVRARHAFHREQCGPHRLDTAFSGHARDGERDGGQSRLSLIRWLEVRQPVAARRQRNCACEKQKIASIDH